MILDPKFSMAFNLARERGYGPLNAAYWAWRYVTRRKVRWFPRDWQRWI